MKIFSLLKKFIRKIFVDYYEIDRICDKNVKVLEERIANSTAEIKFDYNNLNSNINQELHKIREQQEQLRNEITNLNYQAIKNMEELKKFENRFNYSNTELLNIQKNDNLKNILIIGFYGAPNLGDELMLETLLEYFEEIPNKTITVLLADNPEYSIDKYKDIKFIHYPKSLYDFNTMAEKYDYIIFGGGAIIDDNQYDKEKSYQYDLGTMLIKLSLRAIAFNKKVICIALSASKEIKNKEYLEKLAYIIKNASYFSVRDDYTQKYLCEKLGEEFCPYINRINDIVFANDNLLQNIQENSMDKEKISIGIVAISNNNNLEKLEIIIKDINKYYKNAIINLIPFYEYKDMDTLFYKKVLENNKDLEINIKKIPENMKQTIELYKKNDIIIGMRYHSILLAYALNIACVSICYDIHEHYLYKISYLNELFNKTKAVSYKDMKENDILNRIKDIYNNNTNNDFLAKKILTESEKQMIELFNSVFL